MKQKKKYRKTNPIEPMHCYSSIQKTAEEQPTTTAKRESERRRKKNKKKIWINHHKNSLGNFFQHSRT